MSARSHQKSEDQFLCCICLQMFTDPVTTPCGHNFCKTCINQHWQEKLLYDCPLCKEKFPIRPQLKVNTLLSEVVSQFRHEAQQEGRRSSEQPFVRFEVGKTKADIQQMIQKRRLKIQELKKSVKISRDAADRETAEGVQVFTALMEAAQRGLDELIEEIQDKQKATEKQAEDLIKDLEQEISELMKRSSEVEQLSLSEDHLHLLQRFSSLKAAPPTKNYQGMVVRAVSHLEEAIGKEKKKLVTEKLKKVRQYGVDVTLDPKTASPWLMLSGDLKQVSHRDLKKILPDNPERFSDDVCVFGSQSFSSGRFYFEVQVKGKTDWAVGVARRSINRKGRIQASPQNGVWVVMFNAGCEYEACDVPPVRLHLQSAPEKVGVFVDYEEGLVSFYDVDTATLTFSFTGCCFSEQLYPIFDPCLIVGDKISAPLIICPVNQTV